MKILAIETSCDETSAAVVQRTDEGELEVLSHVVATSLALHAQTGGIIPEVAAREQSKYIIPVIDKALKDSALSSLAPDIDAIAVTYGPGLIGSLLIGVETAKTLSFVWKKLLLPVNHLFGHIYANFLSQGQNDTKLITFPLIALIVSGAHTDLLLMKSHTDFTWLGGTRDDAAGECFDKSGRLLGLSYPAGPMIEKKAQMGDEKAYHFPRPLLHDKAYDFSFSGLKTALLREVQKTKTLTEQITNNLCRGVQDAIIDVLVTKTLSAAKAYHAKSILLSGGVAASQALKESFEQKRVKLHIDARIFVPEKSFCTDNAAMIGAAAFFQGKAVNFKSVMANPELYFE